jgi:SAM-dependent methyltransferase
MFTPETLLQKVSEKIDFAEALKDFDTTLEALDEPWKQRDFVVNLLLSEKYQPQLLDYPPAPPSIAPYSDANDHYILGSGLSNAVQIAGVVNSHYGAAARGLKILDFGCGTGRLTRFFVQYSPENDYYGCEVNSFAVDFLKQNLQGHWSGMTPEPPTEYPDDCFDVVVAWSIFTHYAEDLHLLWLKELNRILKPGGLLLATIHAKELLDSNNLDLYQAPPELRQVFQKDEYFYWPFYQIHEHRGAFGIVDQFGQAFFSHGYVQKTWTQMFNVINIQTAVPDWQDLVIATKP